MIKGAVAIKAAVFFIIDEVAVAMILFESLKRKAAISFKWDSSVIF